MYTNLRVRSADHKRLKILAAKSGLTITELIHRLSKTKMDFGV